MKPSFEDVSGSVRIVDSANFAASKAVAAALVILKPGAMREMHWHPNAAEWQYWLAGTGRVTVFASSGEVRTMNFRANDVGYVPAVAGHFIENTGNEDIVFLEMFRSDHFVDIFLNQWLRRLPLQIVQEHLHLDSTEIQ